MQKINYLILMGESTRNDFACHFQLTEKTIFKILQPEIKIQVNKINFQVLNM